jgi:hypothetical protein
MIRAIARRIPKTIIARSCLAQSLGQSDDVAGFEVVLLTGFVVADVHFALQQEDRFVSQDPGVGDGG